jgi:flagellar hook-associated protein 2
MATSSTSAASVASLLAPPTFTGVSKFAASLQQVLTRAVGIASLPLGIDQAALNSLTTAQSDIQGLDTVFTALQQSVSSLQSTVTSNLLSSSVSDSTVSATVGTGAAAGTYTIAVDSLGAFSSALSNAGSPPVTDPTTQGLSSSFPLTLTVGIKTTTITPTSSDLQDLASAINSQAGGQVEATLVNVGSTSSPDYRLSLQATKLGTDAIDLTDSSAADLILPPIATALSNAGSPPVTDPATSGISSSFPLTLTIGASAPITITPASSDLQDLADAINSQSGGQVQATLVNAGSASSPDYRLSLQAATPGTGAINLTDSSAADLTSSSTLTAGSLASYRVDGLTTPITSNSRTVTLSTGLTLNLLARSATGASTTITVADNPAGLASAFSSFAGAYNAAVDALAQYHGAGGGALEGDSLVQTLTSTLNQLGTYNNGSPASALANFGITLEQTGQLSVDTTAFTSAASANFPALLSTLGSATTGGFLQAATKLITGIEDPSTGAIKTEEKSVAGEITTAQTNVSDEQAKVNLLQTNLTTQIAQADSAIASLESQVSFVTGLFAQYTGAYSTQANGLQTL